MTRSTERSISDFADSVTDHASKFASDAADKVGALFGQTDDSFTDRLVARARSIDAKDFVPSRQTVAKGGAGAGLLLAGAAAFAAGAFALYYWRERSQEEPAFDLLAKDGDFELRRYKAALVAESVQPGDRDEALKAGFKPLAAYIFDQPGGRAASEDAEEKIAMTIPVTATSDASGSWRVRFFPPRAQTRATLPQPAAGVTIAERPVRHVATIRFAGRSNDDALIERKREALTAWIAERGFTSIGDPEYAFYNSPIVPGALRRNEVWIAIEAP